MFHTKCRVNTHYTRTFSFFSRSAYSHIQHGGNMYFVANYLSYDLRNSREIRIIRIRNIPMSYGTPIRMGPVRVRG